MLTLHRDLIEKDGLDVIYKSCSDLHTGTCLALTLEGQKEDRRYTYLQPMSILSHLHNRLGARCSMQGHRSHIGQRYWRKKM